MSDETIEISRLEEMAVSAIKEHRALLAADQDVYDEWIRASEDPSVPSFIAQSLQDEYLARQKISEAQQKKLSDLIDRLGFVPAVIDDRTSK
ncbi:transcriptional repressor TraM (plasmid) [Agrobacterium tumefaciens]|uniref:transcriptional repressor TraM n=1 Tax=Agrobacterium tumefaciens TaxID=358 RepID=UPI00287C69BD|nr:transcriptional repressor TraM [Agrobacterium tumefaciens]MDS7598441.1 transcriptional repressor TraM [Agrobacterium tumefaciens]WKL23736.1 transcriptional repressor TraM [Agrobacterium tumefaciens]